MPRRHPPNPGGPVEPTHPSVASALEDVDFPVTKRELMDEVAGRTVLFHGRNADLRDIVRDVPDDAFDTETELLDALDMTYGPGDDADAIVPPPREPPAPEPSRENRRRA